MYPKRAKAVYDKKTGRFSRVEYNPVIDNLIDKRRATYKHISGTGIWTRIKPTAHKQYCPFCHQLFNKGEKQVIIPTSIQMTFDVYRGPLHHSFNKPRYLYLHTHCFACSVSTFSRETGVFDLKTDCSKCPNRFICFTQRGGIREQRYAKLYNR